MPHRWPLPLLFTTGPFPRPVMFAIGLLEMFIVESGLQLLRSYCNISKVILHFHKIIQNLVHLQRRPPLSLHLLLTCLLPIRQLYPHLNTSRPPVLLLNLRAIQLVQVQQQSVQVFRCTTIGIIRIRSQSHHWHQVYLQRH